MTASYPTSVKTFDHLVDDADDVLASHQNDRAEEITAIETELGISPSGASATVKARLDKLDFESAYTPTSGSDAGSVGTIRWDSGYLYVCVATDTWKRASLSSF